MRRGWFLLAVLTLAILAVSARAGAQERSTSTIDLIDVRGLIDPPTSDYVRSRIRAASDQDVEAVILQLDTPGSVGVSVEPLRQAILRADIPTVVWIAPRGAQATGEAVSVAAVADVVLMAPDTFIGRLDAAEAVERGTATALAGSLSDLLESLDGLEVDLSDIQQGPIVDLHTLETWDETAGTPSVTVRFQQMDLLQRLLHAVTSPEVAFFLLLLGMFGLIFELYNPGIGLAALLGVAALVLSFYALSVLPTNWPGVLLVVAAVVLLLVDLDSGGLGGWSAAGVTSLIVGGVVVFSGAPSALSLSPWAIFLGIALTLVFFISVMTAALRVRLRRPITDDDGIVGSIAEAKTDIAPEGTVLSKGALWRARTMETGIAAGSRVQVKATEGLVLLVEPVHPQDDSGLDT